MNAADYNRRLERRERLRTLGPRILGGLCVIALIILALRHL